MVNSLENPTNSSSTEEIMFDHVSNEFVPSIEFLLALDAGEIGFFHVEFHVSGEIVLVSESSLADVALIIWGFSTLHANVSTET